jgi:hypothetical protein
MGQVFIGDIPQKEDPALISFPDDKRLHLIIIFPVGAGSRKDKLQGVVYGVPQQDKCPDKFKDVFVSLNVGYKENKGIHLIFFLALEQGVIILTKGVK